MYKQSHHVWYKFQMSVCEICFSVKDGLPLISFCLEWQGNSMKNIIQEFLFQSIGSGTDHIRSDQIKWWNRPEYRSILGSANGRKELQSRDKQTKTNKTCTKPTNGNEEEEEEKEKEKEEAKRKRVELLVKTFYFYPRPQNKAIEQQTLIDVASKNVPLETAYFLQDKDVANFHWMSDTLKGVS